MDKLNYPIDFISRTRKEMANLMGLPKRTFERELHRIKFKNGGKLITPKQQIKILKKLGYL